jgi:hypothetical protein
MPCRESACLLAAVCIMTGITPNGIHRSSRSSHPWLDMFLENSIGGATPHRILSILGYNIWTDHALAALCTSVP